MRPAPTNNLWMSNTAPVNIPGPARNRGAAAVAAEAKQCVC